MNERNRLDYVVKMRFFEAPNFSLTSDSEEVVLARVQNHEAAQVFSKSYALEAMRELGASHLKSLDDLKTEDDFGVTFNVGEVYLSVTFGKTIGNMVTVMDFKIEQDCPNCGYAQYPTCCMSMDHRPACGTFVVEQRGRWIEHPYNSSFGYKYECSICHKGADLATDYCPHCGIKIDNRQPNHC